MEAFLSIDLGTTTIKSAVYSPEGQILGASRREYPLICPSPGVVEQDANLWWSLAAQTTNEAVSQAGVAGRGICAISVSSQGISFVPIDRSGNPLRSALCWLDTRASTEAEAVRAEIGAERLFQLTGKRPSAAYVLPKLLWLRSHEPELYARTDRFLLAHDFLLFRMCGRKVTDPSLAGGSLLLDIHSLAWSEDLISAFQIDPGLLPDLAPAGTVAGELTCAAAGQMGLQSGIPVVVGGQDQKCAALGAAIRPGVATVSLGTAAAISCLTREPILDPLRRIPAFPFVIPGYWDLEGVVGTAGAALRWARDTFFPQADYPIFDEWARQAQPGAGGVWFYPHLAGATSPIWDGEARGTFRGLSLAAGKSEIVRSILEGVAYQIRANLEVIEDLAPVNQLILFGGGAKSRLWSSIIAEVTGKPVIRLDTADIANWGACLLAGAGIGRFQNLLDRSPSERSGESFYPEAGAARRYKELYEEYLSGQPER